MLKVTPRTVVRSYGRTVVWSYGRTTKFFRLDGLLLFRIVMGLRSASSAIIRAVILWMDEISNEKQKEIPGSSDNLPR